MHNFFIAGDNSGVRHSFTVMRIMKVKWAIAESFVGFFLTIQVLGQADSIYVF